MEDIYQTYAKEICSKCKNRQQCEEELRVRIDKTIKCEKYEEGNI